VLENVLSAVNTLDVYVFGIVVEELMKELMFESPYVPTQVPEIEKQPVVMLKPTLDVDVALPAIVKPDSVVVPNPELDTRNHGAVVEPTHREKVSPATELIESLADGDDVPTPRLPVKLFVLENVLKSVRSVEEAAVPSDVSIYTEPSAFVFRVPAVVVDTVIFPTTRLVVEAVINDE
jgi:hypothetical protein